MAPMLDNNERAELCQVTQSCTQLVYTALVSISAHPRWISNSTHRLDCTSAGRNGLHHTLIDPSSATVTPICHAHTIDHGSPPCARLTDNSLPGKHLTRLLADDWHAFPSCCTL